MKKKTLLKPWLRSALPALLLVLLLRSAVAEVDVVPTGSMAPTIRPGDHILVNKSAYGLRVPFTTLRLMTWSHPRRGDVVTFVNPIDGRTFVKRVVALGGDTVALRGGHLIVNGQEGPAGESCADFGPVAVPEGQVFVLGDHRSNSKDSRVFGSMPESRITGRAWEVLSLQPMP